ncbi:MAG: signal peptidase I [Candidatus Saccharimonadales bacterium]
MKASFLTRHPFFKDAISVSIFVLLVTIGAVTINTFVFRSFSVVGPSMETTLYTGDRLIVNKIPVTLANIKNTSYLPQRGEVIVFKNPRFPSGVGDEYIVKRVIALPGERVVLENGEFTIYNNDNPDGLNPDKILKEKNGIVYPTSGSVDIIVSKNEIFVSGDHRQETYSLDSRNGLGTIPIYEIIGPVSIRIYPFNKIRLF